MHPGPLTRISGAITIAYDQNLNMKRIKITKNQCGTNLFFNSIILLILNN